MKEIKKDSIYTGKKDGSHPGSVVIINDVFIDRDDVQIHYSVLKQGGDVIKTFTAISMVVSKDYFINNFKYDGDKSRICELENKNEILNKENASKNKSIYNKRNKIKLLDSKVKELESLNEKLKSKLYKKEAMIEGLEKSLFCHEQKIITLERDLRGSVESYKVEIIEKDSLIEELENKLKDKDMIIVELNKQLHKLEVDKIMNENELSSLNEKNESKDERIHALKSHSNKMYSKDSIELLNNIIMKNDEISFIVGGRNQGKTKTYIDKLNTIIDDLQKRNKTKIKSLNIMHYEINKLKDVLKNEKELNDDLTNENIRINNFLEQKRAENTKYIDDCKALQSEVYHKMVKIENLERQLDVGINQFRGGLHQINNEQGTIDDWKKGPVIDINEFYPKFELSRLDDCIYIKPKEYMYNARRKIAELESTIEFLETDIELNRHMYNISIETATMYRRKSERLQRIIDQRDKNIDDAIERLMRSKK